MKQLTYQDGTCRVVSGEVLRENDIHRLQEQVGRDKVIVIQHAQKPWGWIIGGSILGLFLLASFVSSVLTSILEQSERQSQRAHELAVKALSTVEATQQVTQTAETLSLGSPLVFLVVFLLGALFLVILKSMA